MSVTSLRLMQPGDLPGVNVLLVRAFSAARQQEGMRQPELSLCRMEFLRYYLQETPESNWVAVEGEQVLGAVFGHAAGPVGWIGPLAVLPERQNQGFGRSLLRHAEEALRIAGCRLIGLETDADSLCNIAFYSRLGFTPGPMQVDLVRSVDSGWPGATDREVKSFSQHPAQFAAQLPAFLKSHGIDTDYLALARRLEEARFGDSYLVLAEGQPFFFAALQLAPVSVHETAHVGRIMGLVGPRRDAAILDEILQTVAESAECRHLIVRISTHYSEILTGLLRRRWRLAHAHLRFYLLGGEKGAEEILHLNKWD
ncbi:MAG TPA: GNAT family N-acetyltransferase [bacterium]|nr:GNAT family N-acetyltransferase [bacterium]HQI48958.1 GNAT family N-acetyltransferase [bacterium]HQJ64604.1 GNAT family N-acetyltransferase [bacterium]